jgi:hemolysin activation/secretion protein
VRALACAIMLGLAATAEASPVPSTAEPGRSSKDLTPQAKPKASPDSIVPIRPGSVAPDQADKVTFTLKAVTLDGARTLPEARLAALWSQDLNRTISVTRLFEIVNAITNEYARAGYALSFALLPEQDITEGTVRIAVVEGFIDEIIIDGASASGTTALSLGGQVAAQVARLKASRPLKTAELERALLLLNDLPGVTARAVFAASKTTPQASTMTLSIARDRVSGTADVNNRMSDALGNWRAGGTLSLDGLLTDTTGVQLSAYRALDSGSFAYGAVSLSQPVSTDGLMLGLEGSYSRDVPLEGILKSIDFEGESVSAALSLAWPLIRSRPENLTLSAGLRMSNMESQSLGTTLTQDRVRLIELAATWDVADRWSGLNLVRLTLTQGLDIAGATDDASLFKSRANGSATFTSLGLSAARQQGLTQQLSLYASVEAQAGLGSPMLAASECSWGGQRGGRAYDAGVLSGDHCASGLVELRVDEKVSGFGVQLYGFADAAIIAQKGELQPGEKRHEQASSAGGGVRLFLDSNVSLNAELAMPLRERYSDEGETDPRAFFSATARF